jgi:DNA ligase-1
MSLKPILAILDRIANTPSIIDKEELIKTCLYVPLFKDIVFLAINPFLKYKIRNIELTKNQNADVIKALDMLITLSQQTGADHIDRRILAELSSVDTETVEVINRILKKDLRCGASTKLFRRYIPEIPIHEPMLCNKDLEKFLRTAGSMDNIASSVKLDGVRVWCIINGEDVKYISRNGQEYPNFNIFDKELLQIATKIGMDNVIIFDGEVITKDKDFQKGLTQFRRLEQADPEIFELYVFDIINSLPFYERYRTISSIFTLNSNNRVKYLKHGRPFKTIADIYRLLDYVTEQGDEGLVLKTWNGPYEFKRSNHWCKVKKMLDEDLPVIGKEEGQGKYTGTLGALICNYKGVEVNVGSGFSDEERDKFWVNPPKLIEVQYQGVTKDGSLRFPVFIRVREELK